MSDLYSTIQSLHLHNLSDTDSEESKHGSCDTSRDSVELTERMDKAGRLPLPLGNTTIESPSNFGITVDSRNGASPVKCGDSVPVNDAEFRNGSLAVNIQNDRAVSFNNQQEKVTKGDSQSLSTSPQRKLPIPNAAMNTNPNLKGILIKPKRILPAQPDHLKAKSAQNRTSAKTEDKSDHGLTLDTDVVSHEQTSNCDSGVTQTSKSPVDIQKIKAYFGKHGADCMKTKPNDTDDILNSADTESNIASLERSNNDCDYVSEGYLTHEQEICDLNKPGNMSKSAECESSGTEVNNNKVCIEKSTVRSLERGIRSPSPKSNTTWDRSSSGYSSDERPDPRSPPPVSSAGTSSKHSLDTEDDNLTPEIDPGVLNTQTTDSRRDTGACTDIPNLDNLNLNTESAISDSNAVVSSDSCSNGVTGGPSITPQPPKCSCDIISKNKTDLGPQTAHSSAFETISPGIRQHSLHKPTLTLPNRIQYRKSGSEAMINLRHSNRQSAPDTYGGLEVLGRSYRQQSCFQVPGSQNDAETVGRSEIPTPSSTDSQADGATDMDLALDLSDVRNQEAAKSRIIRQQLMALRSPRDTNNMGMNGKCGYQNDAMFIFNVCVICMGKYDAVSSIVWYER